LIKKQPEAPTQTEQPEPSLDDIFRSWGDFYQINPAVLKAIATVESGLDPSAMGDGGASFGLMQVQPATARQFIELENDTDLLDPNVNIQAGGAFISFLIHRYGLEGAIQAYNLGETKYRKGLTSPDYLSKVQNKIETVQI